MIVEYIRYKLPSRDGDTLITAYEVARKSLEASPHCLGFELTRCSESAETFVLRILWDSVDGHMKGFRTSPEFGPFFSAVQPFLKSIEEMRHYELTTVHWSR
jgi:heme-degrading monooxygenase HmoA